MFTGIVEETGKIKVMERRSNGSVVHVLCSKVLEGSETGDSIAVNGVCLTVESISDDSFSAFATFETLSRSTLGEHKIGQSVNLERALKVSGRLGGHIVQGHVDTVGEITADRKQGSARIRTFRIGNDISKYIVEKGSVTIDGVSLTVAEKEGNTFSVSIIPETGSRTTIPEKKVGDKVNIEVDIIAKYVESLLSRQSGALTMEKLVEAGF
jgi:riboflavin synthase